MAGKTNKKDKKKAARTAKNSKERKELVIQTRSELANLQTEIDANTAANETIEAPAEPKKAEAVASETTKKAAPKASEAAEKAAPKASEAVEEPAPKASEAVEEPAPKASEATEKAASKTVSYKPKKEATKKIMIENFFEIDGTQVCAEKVCEKIQKAWEGEGHKASELESLKTYYNFAERKAYYVINGEPAGFVEF